MDDLFTEVVSPRDLALLVGVPRDAGRFLEDIDFRRAHPTDGRGDFAFSQVGAFERPEVLRRIAQAHGVLIERLLVTAARIGMPEKRVFPAAGLEAVHAATTGGARVVILLGHWRTMRFSRADFAQDIPLRLPDRLRSREETIASVLENHLANAGEMPNPLTKGKLADLLNGFVAGFGPGEDQFLVRDALDAILVGLCAPGNAMELRDGVHKAPALARELPSQWSGIMDLGVCHSFQLAKAFKAGRQDRRMLTNNKRKVLDRIVPELCETLLSLGQTARAYIPLKAEVTRRYTDLIAEV